MSLDITPPTDVGESTEQRVHAFWDTLDDVRLDAMKEGFPPIERPRFGPPALVNTKPEDIDADTYYQRCAQYSSWYTYATSCRLIVECGIEECDNELKQLAASIRKHIRATVKPKPSEDAIKDEVHANPRYNDLMRIRQMYVEKKRLIEPFEDRYGRELRILSRVVELRRQELDMGRVNGIRNAGGPGFQR